MGRRRKGRSSPPFVMLQNGMLDSPKWKALRFSSQCLYVRLKRKFNGYNNGDIYLSYGELSDEFARATICQGFKELKSAGAIRVTKFGGLYREHCKYEIVENWWCDQRQYPFSNRHGLKNGLIGELPGQNVVQKKALSKAEENPAQVQKTAPYLESAIPAQVNLESKGIQSEESA